MSRDVMKVWIQTPESEILTKAWYARHFGLILNIYYSSTAIPSSAVLLIMYI